jgi:tetratricopeptide (TPR) repeat protein
MNAAILLPPRDKGIDFLTPTEPDGLRRHLADGTGRLIPVVAHLSFEQVLAENLELGRCDSGATLVVYVGPHVVLDRAQAESLELPDRFEMAEQYINEQVEQGMQEGYERVDGGDVEGARHSYTEVDKLLGQEDSPRHALVLVSLGELERKQGRIRQATALLERALAIAPTHIGALRGRAALAQQAGESAIAAAMLYRLVPNLDSDGQRLETLSTVASESLHAAKDAIEHALRLKPGDRELLERLRAIHEASGNWPEAVSVGVQLAEALSAPNERARAFVYAARMASERALNTQLAVALYEAAIEDEPSVAGAFEAIEAELVRSRDHAGLAQAYHRQIDRLGPGSPPAARVDLLRRLAHVQRQDLRDPTAAIAAFDRLLAEQPDDADARVELAELLRETNQGPLATRVLEVAAKLLPARAETYRSLLSLFEELHDPDRAFNATSVLVALGEADLDEQLQYAQYAPENLLSIASTVDEDMWEQLTPPQHPSSVHRLLAAIETAALSAWHAENEPRYQSVMPPPSTRVDPSSTTVSAVKAFAWVARVLGVEQPDIHAVPDHATLTAATLPCRRPALALGRRALSGWSLPELSFMAAHHLAFSRPGCRLLPFYSDLPQLGTLVRATVALCRPELSASLDGAALALRTALERQIDPAARAAATSILSESFEAGGKLDVAAWLQSVETTACRAALLVSGDVTVAANVLAVAGAAPGGRSARDRALELMPFAISQSYTALRHLLGVAVGR